MIVRYNSKRKLRYLLRQGLGLNRTVFSTQHQCYCSVIGELNLSGHILYVDRIQNLSLRLLCGQHVKV